MNMDVRVTFGPPGTGKTTAMLDRIAEHIEAGIPPHKIAFVSYTKKAVTEAKERASERFGIDAREFSAFRTIHSTAYRALSINRNEIMSSSDYGAVGKLLGLSFRGRINAADGLGASEETGDYMLQLINLANARCSDLRDVWNETDKDLDWYRLLQLQSTLIQYKQDMQKMDFDDLLSVFARERPLLDIQAAVIDEAQDLSNAQWNVAKCAFRKAKHIDIAGDDDQAIYGWSGANVERFLAIKAKTRVLDKSYRLPRAVHTLASGVVSRISFRHKKTWAPRDDEGNVDYITDENQLGIDKGEWLLLARNGYLLQQYKELCVSKGIPYIMNNTPSVNPDDVRAIVLWGRKELSEDDAAYLKTYTREKDRTLPWYDALTRISIKRREYYLSVLRGSARLQDPPRVTISTIHGAKGGEADNVALMLDMASRSFESMERAPDNEHRVFYVGATRARKNLIVIQPKTDRGYLL